MHWIKALELGRVQEEGDPEEDELMM